MRGRKGSDRTQGIVRLNRTSVHRSLLSCSPHRRRPHSTHSQRSGLSLRLQFRAKRGPEDTGFVLKSNTWIAL